MKLTKEKIRTLRDISKTWQINNHKKFGLTKKQAKIVFK